MKTPCPSCPDGNEWGSNGPTGRCCQTCLGEATIGEDEDSEFCECGAIHTEDELAAAKCDACGKVAT